MSKKFYRYSALIWGIVIAVLSLMPSKVMENWTWDQLLALDKVAHLIIYLIFALLYGLSLCRLNKKTAIQVGLIIAIYGILLEVLQNQMYLGRHFEVLDIIANITGLILGLIIAQKITKLEEYDCTI